jgi:hypothetical protein
MIKYQRSGSLFRLMKLKAAAEESYCLKTQKHVPSCNGTSHSCYRCGMFLGGCDCPSLGSPLDY